LGDKNISARSNRNNIVDWYLRWKGGSVEIKSMALVVVLLAEKRVISSIPHGGMRLLFAI